MIAEIGHYALVLALGVAVIQAIVPMVGTRFRDNVLMGLAGPTALAQFMFVAVAFVALTASYVGSDFSVLNVFENSHSAMPLVYKFTSVWGNHEGSMLLWVLILSLYSAAIASTQPTDAEESGRLAARTLAVQALIAIAFLVFILLTSDPFERFYPPPFEGNGLNPLLQDPGLAFHPPLLYLGYVGLSAAFSFAAAALVGTRNDAAWVRAARPFALTA